MNILLHSRNQVIVKILNSCCSKLGHNVSMNGNDDDFELIIRDCDEVADIKGDEKHTIYLLAKTLPENINKKFSIHKPFQLLDFQNLLTKAVDYISSGVKDEEPVVIEENLPQTDFSAQNLKDLGVDINKYMPNSNQKGGDEGLDLLDSLELLNIDETPKTQPQPKQEPQIQQSNINQNFVADLSDDFDLEALARSMENSQDDNFDISPTINLKPDITPEISMPEIKPQIVKPKIEDIKIPEPVIQPKQESKDIDLDDLMKQFESGDDTLSLKTEEEIKIEPKIEKKEEILPDLGDSLELKNIDIEPEISAPKQEEVLAPQSTKPNIQEDIKIDDDILNMSDIDDLLAGIIEPEAKQETPKQAEIPPVEEIEIPSIEENQIEENKQEIIEEVKKEEPKIEEKQNETSVNTIQPAAALQQMPISQELSTQIAQDVRMGIRNGIENEVSMAVGSIFGNKSVLKEILKEMNIKITISFEDK